jgi:hypothetical protein
MLGWRQRPKLQRKLLARDAQYPLENSHISQGEVDLVTA